jgi:subtilisin family serine protease
MILAAWAGAIHAAPARVVPGELLVLGADPAKMQFRPDGRIAPLEARLQGVLDRHGLTRFAARGPARAGARRLVTLRSDRADFDPRAAAAELAATGAFRAVAPNLRLDLYETVPNDFYFLYQWHLESPAGTDAQLTDAWDLWKGDAGTVIAVIDNGFDVTHEDLASQVRVNAAEIPGNSVDDDGNGYVDDVKGWDFGNHDNDPISEAAFDPSGLDVGFHGSFVAGIAAAATNNGIGIAGAGWNCRFMPLKVAQTGVGIPLSAVAEAFGYIVDQGASVINLSLGTADPAGQEFFQTLVNDATAANILCVAAAGNSGNDTPTWPAACNGVLAVGASDESDARASFSNYGPWVDIAAPGSLIWSSICNNYEFDFTSYLFYLLFFGYDGVDPYMFGDGTSFASPLVAGTAALVRSKMPALTPAQVAAHLVATGDVVTYDQPIGTRLNAYRALNEPVALGVRPVAGGGPSVSLEAPWPNPFGNATTIAFTLPEAAPIRLAVHDASGRLVRTLVSAVMPPGRHAIRWDGAGAGGRALGSGIYFATLESGGARVARKVVLAR